VTFDALKSNKYVQGVGAAIVMIAAIALVIAGGGVIAGLLLVILIGISIYFGSIRILSGSALLAVLLKTISATVKVFAAIWFAGPKLDSFFSLIATTGYIHLILFFFFVFYLLAFATSSIRLFSFENKTNIENKVDKPAVDPAQVPPRTINR
jgi:hypothetical protein